MQAWSNQNKGLKLFDVPWVPVWEAIWTFKQRDNVDPYSLNPLPFLGVIIGILILQLLKGKDLSIRVYIMGLSAALRDTCLNIPNLEGQGDLGGILITPIPHIVTPITPIFDLLTKCP